MFWLIVLSLLPILLCIPRPTTAEYNFCKNFPLRLGRQSSVYIVRTRDTIPYSNHNLQRSGFLSLWKIIGAADHVLTHEAQQSKQFSFIDIFISDCLSERYLNFMYLSQLVRVSVLFDHIHCIYQDIILNFEI